MTNRQIIQLYRNSGTINGNYASAVTAFNQASDVRDGEIVLARYEEEGVVKTALGVYHKIMSGETVVSSGFTTFKSAAEIEAAITAQGSNATSAITALQNQLVNGADVLTNFKDVETAIAKILGETAITTANIATIENNLNALDGKINALSGATSAVAASDGEFITAVSTKGGVITANTKGSLSSTNKTINIENFDIDVNIDGATIVKGADGKLSVASGALTQYVGENAIVVGDVDAEENEKTISLKIADNSLVQDANGVKTNLKLKKIATPTDGTLAAQYKLVIPAVGTEGESDYVPEEVLGDVIDVAKDQHLKSAVLGSQPAVGTEGEADYVPAQDALVLTWFLADGSEDVTYIPLGDFLREAEFKNGLEVAANGEVSVKVANDSESFLEVTGDGVAVKGVQAAINDAVSAAEYLKKVKAETVVVKNEDNTDVTVAKGISVSGVNAKEQTIGIKVKEDGDAQFGFDTEGNLIIVKLDGGIF